MRSEFSSLAILGVGLVGGSLGKACRKRGVVDRVVGWSRRAESRREAVAGGACDRVEEDPGKAVRGADLVILATPIGVMGELLRQVRGDVGEGAVVSDVGSVKGPVVAEMERVLEGRIPFVGGHPMAGSEASGVGASREDLFDDHVCVLTPGRRASEGVVDRLRRFWERVGARVLVMSAEEHDALVAATSHLLHCVAASLVNVVAARAAKRAHCLDVVAEGFRDTTRIALSSPEMWRDICMANSQRLLELLEEFQSVVRQLQKALEARDAPAVQRTFETARAFRRDLTSESHRARK